MVKAISDVAKLVRELAKEGTYLVGVTGPAGLRGGDVEAIERFFKEFLLELRKLLDQSVGKVKSVCFVNNGTAVGIPGMVVRQACITKFPVFGISPRLAMKELFVRQDILTFLKVVGEEWGDEEKEIVKNVQALILLGGEDGTLSLLADARNVSSHRVKDRGLPPIAVFLVDLPQTRGLVYDFLEDFLLKRDGAEELSRLGVAAATASPVILARGLMDALEVRASLT